MSSSAVSVCGELHAYPDVYATMSKTIATAAAGRVKISRGALRL